ncbi:MAG TPA: hypothetical protein VK745_30725 [Polyangiaceae bacterium]|nr:hypothetical protein [Polyangiaceae bacterium]
MALEGESALAGNDVQGGKPTTNWIVVVAFAIATLSTALSAAAVAVAEPGTARVCAAVLSGVLLFAAVFGLSVDSSDGRARLSRQLLVWASKTRRRSGITSLGLCAGAVFAAWWGVGHTDLLTVTCLDARSITRNAVPGKRVEGCGDDHMATFSVWYPWGRSGLLDSITCNYPSGDKIALVAKEMSCPLRAFTYAQPYDKSGHSWAWHRLLDGSWQERASSNGVYAAFFERGPFTAKEYENCPTHGPITGMLVQRVKDTPDDQDIELLIPSVLNEQARILERYKPTLPWFCLGVVVSVP